MSMKKAVVLILILLVSGGCDNSAKQAELERIEQERKATARAEQERIEQEAAKKREEQEALAKAEQERIEQERIRLEQEAAKKAEQERIRQEQEAAKKLETDKKREEQEAIARTEQEKQKNALEQLIIDRFMQKYESKVKANPFYSGGDNKKRKVPDILLHQAIKDNEDVAVIKYLVNIRGADVNAKDHNGLPPLALMPCNETISFLVSQGASINEIKVRSAWSGLKENLQLGTSLLHWVIRNKEEPHDMELIQLLVSKGVDVNAKDKYGNTAFHFVKNIEIAKFLVSKGADVNVKNKNGDTPLHLKAHNANVEIAKFLVSNGANVTEKNTSGETPLNYAARNGDLKIVEFLVSQGASVNEKDRNGITPLHWAVLNYNISVVKFLVSQGADVYAKTNSGYDSHFRKPIISQTPLDMAISLGEPNVVKILVPGEGAAKDKLVMLAESENVKRNGTGFFGDPELDEKARIKDTLERNAIRQAIQEEERRLEIYKEERRKLNLD